MRLGLQHSKILAMMQRKLMHPANPVSMCYSILYYKCICWARCAGFAVVKLATDRSTGEEYAVKIMALPEANAKAGDNENTRYCMPHATGVMVVQVLTC